MLTPELTYYVLVLQLARAAWEVRAVCDESDNCLVLDFLGAGEKATRAHRMGMLSLVREHIPRHGVPPGPLSGPLGKALFELRKQPGKGPRLRVPFFYDRRDSRIVVCTHAFWKDQPTMPREIQRALQLRSVYYASQRRGDLRLLPA